MGEAVKSISRYTRKDHVGFLVEMGDGEDGYLGGDRGSERGAASSHQSGGNGFHLGRRLFLRAGSLGVLPQWCARSSFKGSTVETTDCSPGSTSLHRALSHELESGAHARQSEKVPLFATATTAPKVKPTDCIRWS